MVYLSIKIPIIKQSNNIILVVSTYITHTTNNNTNKSTNFSLYIFYWESRTCHLFGSLLCVACWEFVINPSTGSSSLEKWGYPTSFFKRKVNQTFSFKGQAKLLSLFWLVYVCMYYVLQTKEYYMKGREWLCCRFTYVHFPTDSEIKILEILLRNGFLLAR